ncbi:hypothetical protein [Mycobacterium marinum]|nr:hypothetical protein [Mycobacterium marinum]
MGDRSGAHRGTDDTSRSDGNAEPHWYFRDKDAQQLSNTGLALRR